MILTIVYAIWAARDYATKITAFLRKTVLQSYGTDGRTQYLQKHDHVEDNLLPRYREHILGA